MILRIVKMRFRPEETESFMAFFEKIKPAIESMPGLKELKICRNADNKDEVFTLSTWMKRRRLKQL